MLKTDNNIAIYLVCKVKSLRAVAKKGGVIGICFSSIFLGGTPGISRIVEHIRHAVDIADIDHVGIGSDFDGCPLPDDVTGLQSMPLIYDELRRSGFSEEETEKIASGNFCRLLREVLSTTTQDS